MRNTLDSYKHLLGSDDPARPFIPFFGSPPLGQFPSDIYRKNKLGSKRIEGRLPISAATSTYSLVPQVKGLPGLPVICAVYTGYSVDFLVQYLEPRDSSVDHFGYVVNFRHPNWEAGSIKYLDFELWVANNLSKSGIDAFNKIWEEYLEDYR